MLDISRIQAITLDLDDTLWPIWPTIDQAELRLQEWLLAQAPRTSALFASTHARLALREQAQRDWPDQHHDLSFVRREMIRLGLQQSGEDQALAAPAFEVFFRRPSAGHPVCRCLARPGVAVGALAGAGPVQRQCRCAPGRHWPVLLWLGECA